jgi:hypothetical protein
MATATAVRPTTTESCNLRDWLKEVKSSSNWSKSPARIGIWKSAL